MMKILAAIIFILVSSVSNAETIAVISGDEGTKALAIAAIWSNHNGVGESLESETQEEFMQRKIEEFVKKEIERYRKDEAKATVRAKIIQAQTESASITVGAQ